MTTANRQWIKIKTVALPSEHGGWGFLLEPILLGLLLAPSLSGVMLSCAALAAFLTHQPLKISLKDWRNGRQGERTIMARYFVLGYGALALISFVFVLISTSITTLMPLLVAVPFVLIQAWYDAHNKSREALAEVSGAIALGSIASTIALIDGWEPNLALGLWLLLIVRSVPSILYVRARLKLERDKPVERMIPWLAHCMGLALVLIMVLMRLAPWMAINGVILLTIRALWGLSIQRRQMRIALIGVQELILGLLYIVLIVGGYAMIL